MAKIVRDEKKRVKKGSCYFIASDEKLMSDDDVTPNDIFKLGLLEHKKQHHPEQVKPNLKQFNKGSMQGYKQDFSSCIDLVGSKYNKQKIITNTLIKLKGQQIGRSDAEIKEFNQRIKPFIEEAWKNNSVYTFGIACDEFINGKKIKDFDFESYGNLENFYIKAQNSFVDNLILQFQHNEKHIILFPDVSSEAYQKQESLRKAKETQIQHFEIKKSKDNEDKKKFIEERRKQEDEEAWKEHKGEAKENPKLKKLTSEMNILIEQGRKEKSQPKKKKLKDEIGNLFFKILEIDKDYKLQLGFNTPILIGSGVEK